MLAGGRVLEDWWSQERGADVQQDDLAALRHPPLPSGRKQETPAVLSGG